MCGIVGGVSPNPIYNYLIEGLKTIEYRGYDSSGIAVSRQTDPGPRRDNRRGDGVRIHGGESARGHRGSGGPFAR